MKLEIRKMSGKLKTRMKQIREKLGNFAKFSEKLKFLILKKFKYSYTHAILELYQLNN